MRAAWAVPAAQRVLGLGRFCFDRVNQVACDTTRLSLGEPHTALTAPQVGLVDDIARSEGVAEKWFGLRADDERQLEQVRSTSHVQESWKNGLAYGESKYNSPGLVKIDRDNEKLLVEDAGCFIGGSPQNRRRDELLPCCPVVKKTAKSVWGPEAGAFPRSFTCL